MKKLSIQMLERTAFTIGATGLLFGGTLTACYFVKMGLPLSLFVSALCAALTGYLSYNSMKIVDDEIEEFEFKSLNYESHVTVEPIFEERLELFKRLCESRSFRVAKLLMQKKESREFVVNNNDAFCTGHGTDSNELLKRMLLLLFDLNKNGFRIRRYKIENIILDSRNSDELFKL